MSALPYSHFLSNPSAQMSALPYSHFLSNPSAQMQFTFPTCLSSRCYTPSSFIPPLFPIPFCTFFMSFVYTLLSPILPSLFSNFPFFLIFPLLSVSLPFYLISSIYSFISRFSPFLLSPFLTRYHISIYLHCTPNHLFLYLSTFLPYFLPLTILCFQHHISQIYIRTLSSTPFHVVLVSPISCAAATADLMRLAAVYQGLYGWLLMPTDK
jgi:hypothetical protein